MSFYEDNKEKLNSFSDLIREGVECDDQEMIIDTLESIPENFWRDRECSTEIMEKFLGCVGSDFFLYPINFIPEYFWEDENNVWSYVVTLCDFYEEERINYNLTELIPEGFLKDKKILKLFLYYNYSETMYYIPDEYKTDKEIIFEALDGLQREIEYRENTCNSWRLPFNKRECFENFISEISKDLSTDKNFIMSLLEYDFFSEDFDVLYDWVDEKFWSDKDFVIEVLKWDWNEETLLKRVSKELMKDTEFVSFLEENFDICVVDGEISED